jgi:predicted RNase H-like HicB family nuclease
MIAFTATVKQEADGSWYAVAHLDEHMIVGDGDTKNAAIESLRKGAEGLFEYLKSKGERLPEVVSLEVAA